MTKSERARAYQSLKEYKLALNEINEPTEAEIDDAAEALWNELCPTVHRTKEDWTVYRQAAKVTLLAARRVSPWPSFADALIGGIGVVRQQPDGTLNRVTPEALFVQDAEATLEDDAAGAPARAAFISLTDPLTIIAGIKQFGLASDGSDLRDLEAALLHLSIPSASALAELVERLREPTGYDDARLRDLLDAAAVALTASNGRVAELERERDEARSECRLQQNAANWHAERAEAAEAEVSRLKTAFRNISSFSPDPAPATDVARGSVAIRSLEWAASKRTPRSRSEADWIVASPVGEYWVSKTPKRFKLLRDGEATGRELYATLAEAQAAAQADYEQRIRSALDIVPAPSFADGIEAAAPQADPAIAELVERLKKLNPWQDMDWPEVVADAIATLTASNDRVTKLARKRDEVLATMRRATEAMMACGNLLADEEMKRAVAETTVTRLREALEPFATVAEYDIGDSEADGDLFRPMSAQHAHAPLLRVGHLRRARAALSTEQ